jgi:hypothetical protein
MANICIYPAAVSLWLTAVSSLGLLPVSCLQLMAISCLMPISSLWLMPVSSLWLMAGMMAAYICVVQAGTEFLMAGSCSHQMEPPPQHVPEVTWAEGGAAAAQAGE